MANPRHNGATGAQLATQQTIAIGEKDKAIADYYRRLDELAGGQRVEHEGGLRRAFESLLETYARQVKWTVIAEVTLDSGVRPDGVLRDASLFYRGYWEAKDTHDKLDEEIGKKIRAGYPLTNTIFEDTQRGVLYQNGKRVGEFDLRLPRELADLLRTFFGHREQEIENFEKAMAAFRERIPDLARELTALIARERDDASTNKAFRDAFATFHALCQTAIDPRISVEAVEEMLVQHLLTERLFRTIFNNPDFTRRNAIAAEIERVIDALTARSFNRDAFLQGLDRYYVAIEGAAVYAARGEDGWTEKQRFLNLVYERFFQGFSVRQADTHGIVYTPQEIVDFMCASVEEVLASEFGRALADPGVQILDPATGTGNFIVNLLRRMPARSLPQKYASDLFCNEIMLLPYYIASLNIEHAYYSLTGQYQPFTGISFVDTLTLEGQQMTLFTEENSERIKRQQAAPIMVVIGNPPYNVGQVSENDNNKNRKYAALDGRIRDTYAKDSRATNKNALSDAYVKFFRWATDRLQERDGIVCYVSNNSFVSQLALDGMRKRLLEDFTYIYHLDLHGNVRQNPKLSGTTHNVFGIQVGVGITIAVRKPTSQKRGVYYHRAPEFWRRDEKLAYLASSRSLSGVEWRQLQPDDRNTWLTDGMQPDFDDFLPIGMEVTEDAISPTAPPCFYSYSNGLKTNRDTWAYDFRRPSLEAKVKRMIETYNGEVDRWRRRGSGAPAVDDFVTYDDTRIKWSESLKNYLTREVYGRFSAANVRQSLYRPFCKQWLYFDRLLNERVYQLPQFFPTPATEAENVVIALTAIGSSKPFAVFASNTLVDLHLTGDTQCFPFYTYAEDGSGRRENITDWALTRFRAAYGTGDGDETISKWDIFHYVYGLLHHPAYRARYAENLKRELPRLPLVEGAAAFRTCATIGEQLLRLHLGYESAPEYPLEVKETPGPDGRVTFAVGDRMRLSPDKSAVVVNPTLTLAGIPAEAFNYRLGNRSALDWVIDQYRVTTDARSNIASDPNRPDDPQYIVRLIGQVITVSVETVRLVEGRLAAEVALPLPVAEGVTVTVTAEGEGE